MLPACLKIQCTNSSSLILSFNRNQHVPRNFVGFLHFKAYPINAHLVFRGFAGIWMIAEKKEEKTPGQNG